MSGTLYGREVACDGVDVFTVRDGKNARKDSYIDLMTYLRALGPVGLARGAVQGVRDKLQEVRGYDYEK